MKLATGVSSSTEGAALTEELRIASTDGAELDCHLARPAVTAGTARPGVLLLHGFPSGAVWAEHIGADLPELANRIADELGWVALAIRFRGCGTSTGDFSLGGWMDDVRAGVRALEEQADTTRVWVCGFGTGGSVGLEAVADDENVAGAAMVGSPADFDDWVVNHERLLAHAHQVGAIKTETFPEDLAGWREQLGLVNASHAAERLAPRPLFLLHGGEDDVVPQVDARLVAEAHGTAELRVVSGAGHLLRHDPRAMAILLGWFTRIDNQLS